MKFWNSSKIQNIFRKKNIELIIFLSEMMSFYAKKNTNRSNYDELTSISAKKLKK